MQLSNFDYQLPQELIAQNPTTQRDQSRLLLVNGDKLSDSKFSEILGLFKDGDVLVFNDTKVIPSFLEGYKINSLGEKSYFTLNLNKRIKPTLWSTFIKGAKKIKNGDTLVFASNLKALVKSKNEDGTVEIEFLVAANEFDLLLEKYGNMPLPQYIKDGKADDADRIRYQTVYAKHPGAVAAPTAGLHFTPELIKQLLQKGVKIAYVTLHVGAGTFLPIKTENIAEHKMHSEEISISQASVDVIKSAKRVIAVGTTSLRTLEGIYQHFGDLKPFKGETEIYITPGFKFNLVDVLITNFHLPKSSLLILVAAFAGYENIFNAYQYAIANKYRFYSYGDACWLEKFAV